VRHVVHSGASEARNVDALFFMLQGDRYEFDKKCFRTCYAELVFLQAIGSVGHVLHSGVSEARNANTLFFMLGWDRYGFDKKRFRMRYAKLVFFCIRRDLRDT
jgi:hypothetical protein